MCVYFETIVLRRLWEPLSCFEWNHGFNGNSVDRNPSLIEGVYQNEKCHGFIILQLCQFKELTGI